MLHSIKNSKLSLCLDEKLNITELSRIDKAENFAIKKGLWRLIYQNEDCLENEIKSDFCKPEITCNGTSLTAYYSFLNDSAGNAIDFKLEIKCALKDEDIEWEATLENSESKTIIREFHFPIIGLDKKLENAELIWSAGGGQKFPNLKKAVKDCFTYYFVPDNKYIRKSTLYPGFSAMNCFTINNGSSGIYFGSHDLSFQNTLHLLELENESLNATMAKYPFIKTGEKKQMPGYVTSLYEGSWHRAARKYREWANEWFAPSMPPESIKNMNGWQRIIMKHQYGEILFSYDDLEKIADDGLSAGIDTIFMFGWHKGGHDSSYPEYIPDEKQGGFENLKKNIKKIQKKNVKLILYFNGQLIDVDTDFYKRTGKRISIKNSNGFEHVEEYRFGGTGTALRQFGNKSLVTACPYCPEWLEVLKKCVDISIELGCDGVFFDQLGWTSWPCWDESHGHPAPAMEIVKGKADMIKNLRNYAKSKKPEISLGIEWFSDITAQHADYIHSISGGAEASNDWESTGEKPLIQSFMDFFYYAFPEVNGTDREIRDDNDIERRVNRALLKGLRSDVEIYRCRATISQTPNYQNYLKKANIIRDKYKDIILNGEFIDTDLIETDNEQIDIAAYKKGEDLAVILTQSHRQIEKINLKAPGYKLISYDCLNKVDVNIEKTISIDIHRHGLCVVIFKKA